MRTVIYPVKDLARAKKLYGKLLGAAPSMDEAYYVGFSVEGQDIVLVPRPCLDITNMDPPRGGNAESLS